MVIDHHCLANLVNWHHHQPRLSKAARTLQYSAITFDVSFQEFATTLTIGGTLLICPEAIKKDPLQLIEHLHQCQVERLFLPFVALQQLANAAENHALPDSIRDIITAGEQLKITESIRNLFIQLPKCNLHNHYGPTETHVVTALELKGPCEQWPTLPSIGTPLDNIELRVMDENMKPQPIGIPGELYIAGPCLSQGYLNQPKLNQNKFVSLAIDHQSKKRWYRTGDRVRWSHEKHLIFLGRLDQQLKFRGFRIEPGEIEVVISTHPSVNKVSVVLEQKESQTNLAAYLELVAPVITKTVQSQQNTKPKSSPGYPLNIELELTSFRQWLSEKLPDYMIPTHIRCIENMPLTSSGKIDRNNLQKCTSYQLIQHKIKTAPSTAIERKIHHIWSKLFDLETIDINSNFFELGGHSLLATKLLNRIDSQFQQKVSLRLFFEEPTIACLARHINQSQISFTQQTTSVIKSEPAAFQRTSPIPLSYGQESLWFIHQLKSDDSSYNMPVMLELKGELNTSALQKSFQALIERHEILRTNYRNHSNQLEQIISQYDPERHTLTIIDYTASASDIDEQRIKLEIQLTKEVRYCFDLEVDPLLRLFLFKLHHNKHCLLANFHHSIFDGWSVDVFMNELSAFYNHFHENKPLTLKPLQYQYADYACWQRQTLDQSKVNEHYQYWQQTLNNAPAQIAFPSTAPVEKYGINRIQHHRLAASIAEQLLAFSNQQHQGLGINHYMFLMSAYALLLQRLTGQSDIVIGTTSANRSTEAQEKLIGFFVNMLPIRFNLPQQLKFSQLLEQSMNNVLLAQEHQELPFELLVKYLKPQRVPDKHPLFQVVFNFQKMPHAVNEKSHFLNGIAIESMPLPDGKAKYDLVLSVTEYTDAFDLSFDYNQDLFSAHQINDLENLYEVILRESLKDINQPLHDIACIASQGEGESRIETINDDAEQEFSF